MPEAKEVVKSLRVHRFAAVDCVTVWLPVAGAHVNMTLSPTFAVMLFGEKVRPPLPTTTLICLPAPAAGTGAPVAVGKGELTTLVGPAFTIGWPYATALAVPAPAARARREAAAI